LPNIIIFVIDDLGWGDISPYNHNVSYTPNIQRLADEGTTYTHFYTPMAICTPFRYSLLTGLHPVNDGFANGVINMPNDPRGIPPERTTMPEFLQSQGYRTSIVGKWHVGLAPKHQPDNQGFDYYDTGEFIGRDPDPIPDYPNLTKKFTRSGLDFIQSTPITEPFYLQMAYTAPHIPLFSIFEGFTRAGTYADMVYGVDWSIGEILREVERRGQYDNTIEMFFADNGPYQPKKIDANGDALPTPFYLIDPDRWTAVYPDFMASHRWGGGSMANDFGIQFHPPEYDASRMRALNTGKGSHYEGGVRIAAIIRWLDGEAGVIDDRPHQIMGVYATLEEELGGDIVYAVDGSNLRTGMASVIEVYTAPNRIGVKSALILDGRWKYHIAEDRLYDLKNDPGETTDVSAGQAGIMSRIRGLLLGERYLPLVWKQWIIIANDNINAPSPTPLLYPLRLQ